MHKYGKFSILAVCLLIFGLVTGNIFPATQVSRAAGTCPIPASPPQVDGTQATAALGVINSVRASALVTATKTANKTLGTLSADNSTTTGFSGFGAQSHATYLANSNSSLEFANTFENTGNKCYTGRGDIAARYAERFSNVGSLGEAAQLAVDSVYLRLPLLEPRLSRVGLGFDTSFGVIDPSNGNSNGIDNFSTILDSSYTGYLVGYPGPNMTSVPLTIPTSIILGEGITQTITANKPRLAGGLNSANGIVGIYGDPLNRLITGSLLPPNNAYGYPISLNFDNSNYNFDGSSFTLFDNANNPIQATLITPKIIATVYSSLYNGTNTPIVSAVVLVPNSPLTPNTKYTVTFNFTVTGTNLPPSVSWSFMTGNGSNTPPIPPPAPGGPAAVATPTPIIVPTSAALTPTPTPGLAGVPVIPPTVGPTSYYQPTPANGQNPPAFFQTWRRVDDPVKNGLAGRSWIYGPLPYGFSILYENYNGGRRTVMYHDKARMELNTPNSPVSNGLLVREMISGNLQLGDIAFDLRTPAYLTVAGDPFELNPTTPTYAAFARVASLNNNNRSADYTNQQVVTTMSRDGSVSLNPALSGYGVTYSYYDQNLGHNIANRFWDYINQTGLVLDGSYFTDRILNLSSVVGLPLSEPYWVQATVGGQVKDVLVQVFERRVMTFTPSNSAAFQVEMGNVGRAYYKWRYGREP